MANIFVTSDTHFSHTATWAKFKNAQGVPMRPFKSDEEMDEFMVEQWNKTVRPQDKIYHLGDVAMKRLAIAVVGRCNGHKRLVRGNHDIFHMKDYLPFFEEIWGSRKLDNLLLTHIPIHPDSIRHDWTNVHGHVHNNPTPHLTNRYFNVCVEVTEYRPLSLEEIKKRIRERM